MSAQAQSPDRIPETGLTVVVPHDNPTLDVVFVHGFTGHPELTWRHKRGDPKQSEGEDDEASEPQHKYQRVVSFSKARRGRDSARSAVFWPRALLPETLPNARVLTYGYDTHIRHWTGRPISHTTVRDIAWNFLVALEAGRRAEPMRPLLFIVHSLGGIIVKEMLRRSSGCHQGQIHLRSVFESTKGIMFFGTPHNGSDPRGTLQRVAELVVKAVGYKVDTQIVNSLLPSSERLGELRDEFGPLALEQQWVIHSFQEQLVVKALSGVKALRGRKVVEDTSSYLNLPAIETIEHIGRNHMDMCRFSGPGDVEYKKVDAALRRMTANLPESGASTLKSSFTPEQRRKLRDSLAFDQIDARLMTIKSAHAKTCKWLKSKDQYLDWLNPSKFPDHHGFLWIMGKPGTGKSTLMNFALAQARRSMKDWVILSFFFNARGEKLEKTTPGMYRSLLLQLLKRIPGLDAIFDSLHLTVWPRDGRMQWSVESLKDLFQQALQSLGQSRVVCFVDALDECDEDQVRDMVSFFEHMGELAIASSIQLRVCFSSRHYPYITIKHGLELVLEGQEGHDKDIADYVKTELKIGHSKVAEDIRAELQAKASSVFMWVVLVVDILNREYDRGRIHALRKRLQEIPAGLHDLFRDMLTRDARDRDELILCIQWVLFAKRPLSPEELYFAVLAGTEPECSMSWDRKFTTLDTIHRFILDSSKGLAETTKSKKAPVVQFIHESVRDFLLKDNGLLKIWPDVGDRFHGRSHERLKECCMKYTVNAIETLQLPTPLPKDTTDLQNETQMSLPFLKYAVRSVLYHAEEAESGEVSQSDFLPSFPLQGWISMDNLFHQYEIRHHTSEATLLYILAEMNLACLIKAHPPTSSPSEPSGERYESPFLAALATGSTEAFLALSELHLSRTTDSSAPFARLFQSYLRSPNQVPKLGRDFCPSKTSWLKLVKKNETEIIPLLLAIGKLSPAGANASYTGGRTPLSVAAEEGHEAMVKLLLSTDKVNPDTRDYYNRTPLYFAAEKGHEAIVKLLLSTGKVDPDAGNRYKQTPLSRAAENGHEAIVKLLLSTGKVDPDAGDDYNRTPLYFAAEKGHEAIVKLLLSPGKVDLDAKDLSGETPLSLAARRGYEAIVKLLLSTGKVDPNAKDLEGRTPLSLAAGMGYEVIVKLLLSSDKVSPDAGSKDRETPLSAAAKKGHEVIVKLLLSTGKVDPDARDWLQQTPMWYAAVGGHKEVVKLLLSTDKVNPDAGNHEGMTPLLAAAGKGHEAIVKLLLGTGNVD